MCRRRPVRTFMSCFHVLACRLAVDFRLLNLAHDFGRTHGADLNISQPAGDAAALVFFPARRFCRALESAGQSSREVSADESKQSDSW
jgi:hypothetical protein